MAQVNEKSDSNLLNYDLILNLEANLKQLDSGERRSTEDETRGTGTIDLCQIDIMMNLVKTNIERAKNSQLLATQMFETVRKYPHLKVVEAAVPEGILLKEYSMVLYDVRIAGHGPDESIYRKDKWIREHITRGMTFMKITGKEKVLDFAIYANRKFTGGVGDEDECQPENNDIWREFCLQPPDQASEVICMTKLNGEAGHFTVRYIGDEFYIIAGSKNVHMLFQEYADIDKYTDSRYLVARTVAKATLNAFNTMEKSKLLCLKHFLSATKMTVVCEVLQPHYQHIVNLSHLNESIVNMLMLAAVATKEENSLTAMPPHLGLKLGQAFGLPTPDYQSVSVEHVQDKIVQMRGTRDSEGFVLYYLQGDQTIGLAKVKTTWYVMLRALREKVDYTFNGKKAKESSLNDRMKSTHKRFTEIQKWLKFNDSYRKKWEEIGDAFFKWLDTGIKNETVCAKNIRPKFPVIWNTFLVSTSRTDDFKLEET